MEVMPQGAPPGRLALQQAFDKLPLAIVYEPVLDQGFI
jgi:hypothetical protein